MLRILDVRRAFGHQPVLRGVTLDVHEGEIMCLLGPSGCGKTTLLRIIAGLERPDAGEVQVNGVSMRGAPVHERGFGLMFQDFALFPHMNVEQNVAFGLRHEPHSCAVSRAHEVLELVGLRGFEKRDVTRLSGGEKQRVALARSLAPRPRLLMLDEPLGSLDAALRERLVVELRQIIKQIGLTAVYVTHDQSEAFAIADRVAIMNAGAIEQVGRSQEVYRQPASEFVARFLGMRNFVPVSGVVAGIAQTPLGAFPASPSCASLLLHPLGIELADHDAPAAIEVRVSEAIFLGDAYRLAAEHASSIRLTFTVPARGGYIPQAGDTIWLRVLPEFVISLCEPADPT